MERQKSFHRRIAFFTGLAALYVLLFVALSTTTLFDASGGHNDRLFSADDLYYSESFFSYVMDSSPRIIKHPLLIVFGCLFTRIERFVFGEISLRHHYELIVAMQVCVSLLSSVYLERVLSQRYKLKERHALLLCAVYALSFSTLFYTFVAESYIISSLLLIMTFYYAGRQNAPVTVILGVLTAGVTITNAVLWAVIVWLSWGGDWKKRLAVLVVGGAAFCAVTAVMPVGKTFFTQIISGGLNSANNYSDHFGVVETLVRVFFVFFGSTAFYLDTANSSPFGEFQGDALSFLPSASVFIVIAMLAWLALLVWAVVKNVKEPLLWAPLGVLGVNLLLHGAIQYGLKEGFLYSLHHLPAQILIVSLVLREHKRTEIVLWCYLACEVLLNVPGYMELVQFLAR